MKWYFLDACSLLNLFASKRLAAVAQALELTYLLLPIVYPDESQFVYTRVGLQKGQLQPIDLHLEFAAGVVQQAPDLQPEELLCFVQLVQAGIDDGEAKSAAAAIARGYGLITDDKKAMRVIGQLYPQVKITNSHTLLRLWVEHEQIGLLEAREVLLNLEIGGNFKIAKNHPEWAWYARV